MTDVRGHKKCNMQILTRHPFPNAPTQEFREATHGCWCASWKVQDHVWYIWSNGRWRKAQRREIT